MVTDASRYLATLATQVAASYVAGPAPRAILLTGSVAEGVSDPYSDLDLIAYYDRLPTADVLASVRSGIGASNVRVAPAGASEAMIVETYQIRGVECQIAHSTVDSWERDMATVLDAFTPATLAEKAIIGLRDGVALHGDDLIGQWQARAAAYPDELAVATVEHHLRFFPLWLAAERWETRDAGIFYHQMLVETSLNLLGVAAGLNHRYFSAFQFKRLHRFTDGMRLAPERLADRLNVLFTLGPFRAGLALERLVDETVTLVDVHLPAVDTTPTRALIGVRHRPWSPTA